jgi:hypothetical protein
MFTFSSGARFDPRRFKPRSWAQKYHGEIGIALVVAGAAAWGATHLFKLTGGADRLLKVFAAVSLLFSWAFTWNRGPIFPPSPINPTNRWKYLTLLGILWLIILPVAWWFAARALRK